MDSKKFTNSKNIHEFENSSQIWKMSVSLEKKLWIKKIKHKKEKSFFEKQRKKKKQKRKQKRPVENRKNQLPKT